jgi:predicted methyltransferase
LLVLALLAGCGSMRARAPAAPIPSATEPAAAPAAVPEEYSRLVAAADRTPADRALDGGRHPAELLAFAGISAGQKVADLGAGGGYTSELLARAVGPSGRVYSQNSPFVVARFGQKPWTARLATPVMANVVRVERDFEDPLPPEARELDAVLLVLVYHDTVWMKVDRERMNAAVFAALRRGGRYVIVDHSARAGSGLADVQTFHRIDEQVVKQEVERAGFRLARVGEFLRNPADSRDWNDSPGVAGPRRGTSDRFVLELVKP